MTTDRANYEIDEDDFWRKLREDVTHAEQGSGPEGTLGEACRRLTDGRVGPKTIDAIIQARENIRRWHRGDRLL